MATEKRLIYMEDVRNALYDADAITMKGVAILNNFPSADVVEVKHGELARFLLVFTTIFWNKEHDNWYGITHWMPLPSTEGLK